MSVFPPFVLHACLLSVINHVYICPYLPISLSVLLFCFLESPVLFCHHMSPFPIFCFQSVFLFLVVLCFTFVFVLCILYFIDFCISLFFFFLIKTRLLFKLPACLCVYRLDPLFTGQYNPTSKDLQYPLKGKTVLLPLYHYKIKYSELGT